MGLTGRGCGALHTPGCSPFERWCSHGWWSWASAGHPGAGALWVPACSTWQGPLALFCPLGTRVGAVTPPVGGMHSALPSLPGDGGIESGRPKGGTFQGAQQRAEPANSDGMRPEELRGPVSPGQSWCLLSQAASGLGRLPDLSGGPSRKLGTGLSSVEATGAPQESSGGIETGCQRASDSRVECGSSSGSQRPGHRLGGRVVSLRPGVACRAGMRRQGEGAGCHGSGVPTLSMQMREQQTGAPPRPGCS